jgi:hypothetical protein
MKAKAFLFSLVTLVTLISGCTNEPKEPKDPLGYYLRFGKDNRVYLMYDSISYDSIAGMGNFHAGIIKTPINLGSFYFKSNLSERVSSSLKKDKEDMILVIYLFSKGQKFFLWTTTNKERSQENWPKLENVTLLISGWRIRNTVYLYEEPIKGPLREGWFWPIFWWCLIGLSFLVFFFVKKRQIKKRKSNFVRANVILGITCAFAVLPIVINPEDLHGGTIYLKIIGAVLLVGVLMNLIHKIVLKIHQKHQKEVEPENKSNF